MIGQDSAEGSFNLISTSKELLHPDLLWNKAQSMIVSLKRIFDTMCMYPTKTKLSGQRQDANLTALTCNGVRWWWRLIGVEMMDPFFCSQSLMLSLVTSVHIYNISKCKDYAAKKNLQGGFFNWSAQKMTKCQITCKSLQKSSKCQNFLRVWDLVIFRADQLKKPPCTKDYLAKLP